MLRASLLAVLGLALAQVACGGGSDGDALAGGGGLDAAPGDDASVAADAASGDTSVTPPVDGGDAALPPPFQCAKASATSPVLAATMLFEPASPHPGDTLTVLVKSTNGYDQNSAPKMTLASTTAKGTSSHDEAIRAGVLGAKGVVYHFEVPDLPLGDVCLLGSLGGAAEIAGKVTVTPRPSPTPSPGVYKVSKNHQFTCQEQVPFGNEFHVAVLDANGKGVPGAVVDVRLPDTTDTAHIKNDDATHPVPKQLTMGADGHWDDYFWWPSNTNGFTVFELSVHGAASDVATEITSGWWETDASGCRYCDPSSPINVYGHWSHRVEFKLDGTTTAACVVPSDHAGQSACPGHGHLYHDPTYQACWTAR